MNSLENMDTDVGGKGLSCQPVLGSQPAITCRYRVLNSGSDCMWTE